MDTVRVALHVGAKKGMIVYRRSVKEMTARIEEHQHAIEEGVEFHWLTNPVEILGNEDGWVTGLKCVNMQLGEPDESGRVRPVPIEGSEFIMPVNTVVLSIGNRPNPLLLQTTAGPEANRKGCLIVEDETAQTSLRRCWQEYRRYDPPGVSPALILALVRDFCGCQSCTVMYSIAILSVDAR